MCVTRKENLEKTADKIIAINAALNSEVLRTFKALSRSLQGIVFTTESLRENGCDQEEEFVRISEKRLRPLFQKGDKKE